MKGRFVTCQYGFIYAGVFLFLNVSYHKFSEVIIWGGLLLQLYRAKIKSLHVIVACPCDQGRKNLIVLFIFQTFEPLAMPQLDPCWIFIVTTKLGVLG